MRFLVASLISVCSLFFAMQISREAVWQIFFLTLGLQIAIQFAFRFIPNSLKVFAVAAVIVFFIRMIWAFLDKFIATKPEQFCCGRRSVPEPTCVLTGKLDKDCEDEIDCWEDPVKRIDRKFQKILVDTSYLTRDIDRFLEVNVPAPE